MILTPAQGNDPPPRDYKGDTVGGLRSDGDKEASGGLHGWLDGRERVAPCKQPKQFSNPKCPEPQVPPGTTPPCQGTFGLLQYLTGPPPC